MNLNKTKIVATIGPACSSRSMLSKLISSGVDVFRINFSHATHVEVKKTISHIKDLRQEHNKHVTILGDLQGPKIRIGKVVSGCILKKGSQVVFTTKLVENGDSSVVQIGYNLFPKDVKKDEKVMVDDGKIILKVVKTNRSDEVTLEVVQGGELKSNKGVNLPNTKISLPALTEKDILDAKFAIKNSFDWIALSFVRSKNDVLMLRELVQSETKRSMPIISKIEKPQAIDKLESILKVSDGLMVARGDLGLEIPAEEVPINQKIMVQMAKKARKPIIVATQMMESMIENLTPSRAEVNDVANSVMDGADCIMLSAETSVGKYPCEVVRKIGKIISSVENTEFGLVKKRKINIGKERLITNSICYNAAMLADGISASAICTLTNSGYTGWEISSYRPKSLVLVFTSNTRILSQLNLLWGVKCIFYNNLESTDKTVEEVNELAQQRRYIKKGDFVINLAAMPIKKKGQVNTLRITKVE